MDALERFGDDRTHAEQGRAFRGPVARGAGAVLLAGDDDERRPAGDELHRDVVNRPGLAARFGGSPPTLLATGQLVAEPNVGERAAHHHFMIAAARAVGVEVLL